MCGRFTNRLTWDEILRLYRLTMKAPPHNLPRRYICPTDPVDVLIEGESGRDFVRMRRDSCRRGGRTPSRTCGDNAGIDCGFRTSGHPERLLPFAQYKEGRL
jgi:hypothetical protein